MLCESSSLFILAWTDSRRVHRIGFLPILYTTLLARWRASSIQLPQDSPDDTLEELSESQKLPPQRLTGRLILLFWLPALCDLTGTTVRSLPRL